MLVKPGGAEPQALCIVFHDLHVQGSVGELFWAKHSKMCQLLCQGLSLQNQC